jgi:hypothetical protein
MAHWKTEKNASLLYILLVTAISFCPKHIMIESPDRLGVDRVGEHCMNHTSYLRACPWFYWWRSALGSDAQCSAVQGRRRWRPVVAQWSFPSLQRLPLRSVRVLEWGYSGGGEPCPLSPWPPLLLIVLRDRGPTSLLTGWASPIRTRVKGPMGRWAHWWRDQSNTSNLPNQGKMMRFMYSKHGFPSTIARGQKAVSTSYPPGTAIIKFMQSLLT